MKKTFLLEGLDCANCAAELEREVAKIQGVSSASLSFVNQKLTVEYENETVLEKIVYTVTHFEDVKILQETENGRGRYAANGEKQRKNRMREWLFIVVSAIVLAVGLLLGKWTDGLTLQIAKYACFAIAYLLVGYPVLRATVKNIVKGKIFDENFLMTIASIGAMLLSEYAEGVLVMLLYQIGETLQTQAVESSRNSVAELMGLKSDWATVLTEKTDCSCGCCGAHDHDHDHDHEHEHTRESVQKRVRPEDLRVGDVVIIKAGEKVPADGELLNETALLDTKALTGESEYRAVERGGEILSGCINAGGVFTMRVAKEYEDSAVAKILDLMENATSGKAAPEKFITKFARYYTPVVCALALALAFLAPLLDGFLSNGSWWFKDFPRWANSALTFLVISCPCALIISVPLTYFSGLGTCAKQGILVKGATYLDVLAKAKMIAFDKTGTLTEGNFTVCGIAPQPNVAQEELLELAATVEQNSSHPIAKAFVSIDTRFSAERTGEIAGRGLRAYVNGAEILVGNALLMQENGVDITPRDSVYTLVFVAKDKTFLGVIEVGDRIKSEAKEAVRELKNLGFTRSIMITGDHETRAQKIANEVGMYELNARLLPDEKLKRAEELKKYGDLVYVGDGINDAPVMAVADCAVSMGKLGSAAAVEASDMVLISDNLKALPKGVKTARKTRRIVMQNIVFSIVMKAVFMALGAVGVLPLWLAVFADVGVMLLAVANSFRVRAK